MDFLPEAKKPMRIRGVSKLGRRLPRVQAPLVAALVLGTQAGCTREFFREWANQDVSEAIFEKSRDPRWRIDLFTVDPPALSRFADPYDPDVPPAPPDDFAAESMSPVPQWPNNRLMVPAEGTGYLDMLDRWQMENPGPTPAQAGEIGAAGLAPGLRLPPGLAPGAGAGAGAGAPPAVPEPPALPPASTPAPFTPPPGGAAPAPPAAEGNPGPAPAGTTPSTVPGPPPAVPPGGGNATPTQAQNRKRDLGVRLAAFQQTGIPLPAPPPVSPASPTGGGTAPAQPVQNLPAPPPVTLDPNPTNPDLSAPANSNLRPDLSPEANRAAEAVGAEMAGILVPGAIDFNEAAAAGLPKTSRPYRLTIEQAFRLGLMNSRVYQFQLEQLYLASLAVTLQRFAFTPQFYAGLSPVNGPELTPGSASVNSVGYNSGVSIGSSIGGGGFPSPVPQNIFSYATRETGRPVSALNIGTVAGMGKAFNTGGKLLMGFANQVVFNFLGKNSAQPQVQSVLPLSFVQPFLRGGGRAVTLEPLTLAERNLLYQIRLFAKFRQEFVINMLLGSSISNPGSNVASLGFTGGGNADPVVGFLAVLQDVQEVENDRKNLAAYERLFEVYKELIQGESSGLSQLQLDQIDSSVQRARQALITDLLAYRGDLDQFKMQMGLPPDVPLILDRTLTRKFKETFDSIDVWQADPRRDIADLPRLAAQLPQLEDVEIDGRSVLSIYRNALRINDEDALNDLLIAAERVAMEHRLDLMNARAELYDNWRQIRVAANALKGVFNVTITNQFVTPPPTTNPFAFVDQAKQFSLILNAELPLVRLSERNAFRTALINYQRQRRALMNVEDDIKLQIRGDIRGLQTTFQSYEISRQNLVLTIRQKDQGFENIIAPPASANQGAQASQAAIQTTNLISFQGNLLTLENSLVQTWLSYETQRMSLYRDLGTLPYDEWEAYRELFPVEPTGVGSDGAGASPTAGPAGAAPPAQP
jgi:hypothetical protein